MLNSRALAQGNLFKMGKKRKPEEELNKSSSNSNNLDVERILQTITESQSVATARVTEQIESVQSSITTSIQELKEDNSNIRALLQKTLDEQSVQRQVVDKVVKRLTKVERERDELARENSELRYRIDEVEQYGRRNSLKIYGLNEDIEGKETAKETIDKVVSLVNDKLGLKISPEDIDTAHRLPNRSDSKKKKQNQSNSCQACKTSNKK